MSEFLQPLFRLGVRHQDEIKLTAALLYSWGTTLVSDIGVKGEEKPEL